MAEVEHISAATYAPFAARPGVAIVHFWAVWDRSHLAVRRAVEDAVNLTGTDGIHVAMFNTDDDASADPLRAVQIASVPTLFYFRDGRRLGVQIGLRRAADIVAVINRVRAGECVDRV